MLCRERYSDRILLDIDDANREVTLRYSRSHLRFTDSHFCKAVEVFGDGDLTREVDELRWQLWDVPRCHGGSVLASSLQQLHIHE